MIENLKRTREGKNKEIKDAHFILQDENRNKCDRKMAVEK
jgi:hypothetical protein